MIFSSVRGRRWGRAVVCIAAVLSACGGGTSQYEPFVAQRVVVLGDEDSALTAAGQKYSVNAVTSASSAGGSATTDTLDCSTQPLWVQSVASYYGFFFAECNTSPGETAKGLMLAAAGARVADVKVQVDAQLANGGFRDKDLVTVLAGTNDIVDLYQQYPGRPEVDLMADARARGRTLAQQVNRLIELGAKVIVSTIPDTGLTPYARQQKAEFSDTDRAALLSRLAGAFNEQLGVNILLDGRYVGLVQTDLRSQAMVRSPESFGLVNVTDGACTESQPPPLCTTSTLVDGASASNWMWADSLRLGFVAQQQIAALAVDRARRNPF